MTKATAFKCTCGCGRMAPYEGGYNSRDCLQAVMKKTSPKAALPKAKGTAPARGRLVELEAIIERGVRAFKDAGAALVEIRDSRLYRDNYVTFEDYCRARWNLGRSQAYRLIDATGVAQALSPIGDISNEAQARELVPLARQDKAAAVEVLQEVQATGKVTGKALRQAVKKRLQPDLAVVTEEPYHPEAQPDRSVTCPECGHQHDCIPRAP